MLFIGTFFICLFIFMMQFLWRYVDELVGKGLEMSVFDQMDVSGQRGAESFRKFPQARGPDDPFQQSGIRQHGNHGGEAHRDVHTMVR